MIDVSAVLAKIPDALPHLHKLASALPLLKQVAETVVHLSDASATPEQKRVLALETLGKIAAGDDGVLGTPDDRIPEPVLAQIRAVLVSELAGDLLAHFQATVPAAESTEAIPAAVAVRPGWFAACFRCFRA